MIVSLGGGGPSVRVLPEDDH